MAFRDVVDSVLQRLHQGPFGAREDDFESNLPNGGRTGYIPPVNDGKRRSQQTGANQRFTGEQQVWQPPMPNSGWQQPAAGWTQQPNWNAQPGWNAPQAFTQQTGYQNQWQQPAQQAPYESKFQRPAQQTAWQTPQATGWQTPQATGWQTPQATGWQAPQATGWQAAWQPQQTGFAPNPQGQQETQAQRNMPGGKHAAGANTPNNAGAQTGFAQQPQQTGFAQQSQQTGFGQRQDARNARPSGMPDNITYMPGSYVGDDGMAYRHVERLAQPLSAATCYRLIEFMRNEETVIVNTELIHDERENQRCLDLLFGAAFTMNCTFTRISAKSIYLIAPRSVTVMPYESLRQMNEKDAALRWPGAQRAQAGEEPRNQQEDYGNRPLRAARYANA